MVFINSFVLIGFAINTATPFAYFASPGNAFVTKLFVLNPNNDGTYPFAVFQSIFVSTSSCAIFNKLLIFVIFAGFINCFNNIFKNSLCVLILPKSLSPYDAGYDV